MTKFPGYSKIPNPTADDLHDLAGRFMSGRLSRFFVHEGTAYYRRAHKAATPEATAEKVNTYRALGAPGFPSGSITSPAEIPDGFERSAEQSSPERPRTYTWERDAPSSPGQQIEAPAIPDYTTEDIDQPPVSLASWWPGRQDLLRVSVLGALIGVAIAILTRPPP